MHSVRYLILGLLVFGVNLLPAFGPPTWSLLVFARLRWHFDPVLLVGLGALASSAGRLLLGLGFRKLRFHFPARYRANLESLEARLVERRGRTVALAALFVLSPLPSAQLFCAAGLLDLRIVPLTLAFFVGRLVTYSIYVTTAVVVDAKLGSILSQVWGSPWSIALQVLLLLALALLPLVPWRQQPRSIVARKNSLQGNSGATKSTTTEVPGAQCDDGDEPEE
jgi:membrane protein YqaA with SNARE-associated domain